MMRRLAVNRLARLVMVVVREDGLASTSIQFSITY